MENQNSGLSVISDSTKNLNTALTSLVSSTYQGLEFAEQEMQVISMIEKYLTPERIKQLRNLENKQYGFKVTYAKGCDKIPDDTFMDCMVEAFRRGLIPTQNTFNILYGKTVYTTQEGCIYLLKRMGIEITKSSFPISIVDAKGRVIMSPTIWYKRKGDNKEYEYSSQYDIPNVDGMNNSEDFRRGKAKRKILKDLIESITGRPMMVTEEDGEAEIISSTTNKGTGENANTVKIENPIKEKSDEIGEEIHIMVSDDIQKKFDDYIKNSKDKKDTVDRAIKWVMSKKAVEEFKIKHEFKDNILTSYNLDLKVFNDVLNSFK